MPDHDHITFYNLSAVDACDGIFLAVKAFCRSGMFRDGIVKAAGNRAEWRHITPENGDATSTSYRIGPGTDYLQLIHDYVLFGLSDQLSYRHSCHGRNV